METQNEHCPMAFDNETGMTLRDYYAGQALIGATTALFHWSLLRKNGDMVEQEIVDRVWDIAEAMVKEKNERCV